MRSIGPYPYPSVVFTPVGLSTRYQPPTISGDGPFPASGNLNLKVLGDESSCVRLHLQFCQTLTTKPEIEGLVRRDTVVQVAVMPTVPDRDPHSTHADSLSDTTANAVFKVTLASGGTLFAERVVLATGSLNHPVVPAWLVDGGEPGVDMPP